MVERYTGDQEVVGSIPTHPPYTFITLLCPVRCEAFEVCCGALAGGTIATPILLPSILYVLCSLPRGFNAIGLFVLGVVWCLPCLVWRVGGANPRRNKVSPIMLQSFPTILCIIHSLINQFPHTNQYAFPHVP